MPAADAEDTWEPRPPDGVLASLTPPGEGAIRTPPGPPSSVTAVPRPRPGPTAPPEAPLDHIAGRGPAATPVGAFRLVPVRLDRDLPRIARWMNDPEVAAFWELAGPDTVTAAHLRRQLAGDGRSVPCLGLLEGVPMSYWEIYRADLDPLAGFYPARPQDTGLHVLLGRGADRG
ncbi:GNAT family N-acetyltransferase, partial [Streptomyces sp. NPDC057052]|uniref:GNAT family N-acetyltransferase n=1 Tax=Streptomyces sp. NPDC057052 TaxID=3346010 RepID=UPI00362DB499